MDEKERDKILVRLDERTERVDEHLDRFEKRITKNQEKIEENENRIIANENEISTGKWVLHAIASTIVAFLTGLSAKLLGLFPFVR